MLDWLEEKLMDALTSWPLKHFTWAGVLYQKVGQRSYERSQRMTEWKSAGAMIWAPSEWGIIEIDMAAGTERVMADEEIEELIADWKDRPHD